MNRFQYKLLSVAMAVMLLVSMAFVGREAAVYTAGSRVKVGEEKICVVIDAGHGETGYRPKKGVTDPGEILQEGHCRIRGY